MTLRLAGEEAEADGAPGARGAEGHGIAVVVAPCSQALISAAVMARLESEAAR